MCGRLNMDTCNGGAGVPRYSGPTPAPGRGHRQCGCDSLLTRLSWRLLGDLQGTSASFLLFCMSVNYKMWRQVGAVDEAGEKLISVARECLHVGINQCGPDKPFRGKSVHCACISHLKGTVSRDFSPPVFFHHTTSSGANRHAQKLFPSFRILWSYSYL